MSSLKHLAAATAEPMPCGDGKPVTEELIKELSRDWGGTPETLDITAALLERSKIGFGKYGTVLRVNNGRDCVNDLEQELLDALQYLKQARMEGKKIPRRVLVELRMLSEYVEKRDS